MFDSALRSMGQERASPSRIGSFERETKFGHEKRHLVESESGKTWVFSMGEKKIGKKNQRDEDRSVNWAPGDQTSRSLLFVCM